MYKNWIDNQKGGFQQPQGHVQVLLNMLEFGMDPQTALDAPRFCIEPVDESAVVLLEGKFILLLNIRWNWE